MIDLHTHVLPGFDDGAKNWETAVKMCRQASNDGTTGIVATPHFFRGLFPTPEISAVHASVLELQRICANSLIPELQLYLGADCHLHAEVVENVQGGRVPTINGSRYLLLEMPELSLPPRIRDLVFAMKVGGITPIITHPERNEVLSRHPSLLYELVRGGAYAQVTGASLTGLFGSAIKRAAEMMVSKGLVQIIASDAHDPERRPPILSSAVDAAAELIGRDLAEKMVNDVPRAVLEDAPIRFPDPVRPKRSKRKPLWRRLRGG